MKEYVYVRFKVIKAQKNNTIGFFFDVSKDSYTIGNQAQRENVCAECHKMSIPDEQMQWSE